MKKREEKMIFAAIGLLVGFVLWTVLLSRVDVATIGPLESKVGFARVNGWFHRFTGVHMSLYTVTDWLGLVPIGTAFGFAILGFVQWIKRRSIFKVDRSILLLGGFYTVVMAVYALFESVVINYRPVLISGYLEASYPSSTTMLVMCVMPTAMMQLNARIRSKWLKRLVALVIFSFVTFMVIGRLISGVHWLSDIIGGALFSTGIVMMYWWAAYGKSATRSKLVS